MVREAPLGEDRSAARDDAGEPARGHRDVAQQHAGVDREVVDALLGLLDERVAVDLPRQVLGTSADFLERLVDRHGADRHRRVAQDPLARLVDVLAGRQVHHGVGAPERRPAQLVDLFVDRRADGRVADVRVDLHREVPADDHRLELGMVDVGGNDGASARHLGPDELGVEALADRDELHLGRDDAAAGVVQLRHRTAAAQRACGPRRQRRGHGRRPGRNDRQRPRLARDVAPRFDPALPQKRKTLANVVALRAARIVDAKWRLTSAKRDLAHRHPQIPGLDVDLAGVWKRRCEVRRLERGKRVTCGHREPLNPSTIARMACDHSGTVRQWTLIARSGRLRERRDQRSD